MRRGRCRRCAVPGLLLEGMFDMQVSCQHYTYQELNGVVFCACAALASSASKQNRVAHHGAQLTSWEAEARYSMRCLDLIYVYIYVWFNVLCVRERERERGEGRREGEGGRERDLCILCMCIPTHSHGHVSKTPPCPARLNSVRVARPDRTGSEHGLKLYRT